MGLCQAVFNQLGSKQMLLRRAGMVVLELGMESGPITMGLSKAMVNKLGMELQRPGGMMLQEIGPTTIGLKLGNKTCLLRAGMVTKEIGLMKLGQQLQLQRRVLLLGMETGGIPHGSGKMTMKAAKTKLGQKTGLRRFGLSTGTNESEGMTHLPSMASGMPSLDRVETLKGWSGTSSASALATTDGLGDCMHFARSEKNLGTVMLKTSSRQLAKQAALWAAFFSRYFRISVKKICVPLGR